MQNEKAYKELINQTRDIFDYAIQNNDIPEAMKKSLENDVYLFSGLKTHAQLFEASRLLLDDNGAIKSYNSFKKDFNQINKSYNQTYLNTEYDYAVGAAQMAGKWAGFSEGEDYNLQYRTAGDNHVRDSHAKLNRITLPMSDPFWDLYYAPNGWNCRCNVVEVLKDKYELSNSTDAMAAGEKATTKLGKNGENKLAIFRFNPGKQQVIFPPEHPYKKVIGAVKVKNALSQELSFNNYSIDQLKAAYKNQKLDKKKESIIMNNGYVASINSFEINEKLRNKLELSKSDKKIVAALDSLIKSNKLPDNLILYRNDGHGFIESHFGLSIRGLDNKDAISKLKNAGVKSISDNGFLSTSATKQDNVFKYRRIHSEIQAKKGTNALIADNFMESEVILGRNQKLILLDVIEEENKIKIIMQAD